MNDIEKKLEALKAKFLGKLEALQKEAEMQKKQEELKPWKPEVGEKYFVAVEDGADVVQYCEDSIDEFNIRFGNCFRTKERAEQVARKMRLLLRLEQLHDMLCPDYVPDWEDDRLKFYVYFDHEQGNLNITASSFCDALSLVAFETRENAEKAAEILNKETRESK
ncbi:MAG: hypothetical protein UGF38_00035 [Ruminococcus sp.]|nr:hypothetical protein [Ruminococcus sp.]